MKAPFLQKMQVMAGGGGHKMRSFFLSGRGCCRVLVFSFYLFRYGQLLSQRVDTFLYFLFFIFFAFEFLIGRGRRSSSSSFLLFFFSFRVPLSHVPSSSTAPAPPPPPAAGGGGGGRRRRRRYRRRGRSIIGPSARV